MKHVTAAAKDIVSATGMAAWDARRNAAVARATRAMTVLAEAAAMRGPVVESAVWAGFFKLSATEPHRLSKLVDSITMLRLDDVARGLLAYNRNH